MDTQIITLATHTYERAQIVKMVLESEGIECFFEHVNLIQGAISEGVIIKIDKENLAKALEIVEAMKEVDYSPSDNPHENKILVPVDFSDYTHVSIEFALDWALKLEAEIVLFHAYYNPIITTIPFSDAYVYDLNNDDLLLDIREKAENNMQELKMHLKNKIISERHADIKVSSLVIRGIAEEEIVDYTKKHKPYLVIMGTRGKDRKASELIGSVTAEVIELARVPVFAIPEGFEYDGLDKLNNLLYATNFDQKEFEAIDKLEELIKPLEVNIICAHVGLGEQAQWDVIKMKALREHFDKRYNETNVQCDLITYDDFWVGIESFVQEKGIDIISLSTHRKGILSRLFNPSIAKKMLFHTKIPLLVFHT